MKRRLVPAAAAAAVALTGVAMAQDMPPTQPTRDAAVTYKSTGRKAEHTMLIRYAASGLMRMEMSGMNGGYAVIDRKAQKATMVMPEQRMYMELASSQIPQPGAMPDKDAKFTRKGSETIAGQSCTIWDYTSSHGTGSGCITADGVMLRATGKDGAGLEATNVSYDPQPDSAFVPPAGFHRMEMPGAGAPGGIPPARPPAR
jgi:hypothetical protein